MSYDIVARVDRALSDPNNLDLALHPEPLVRELRDEVKRLRMELLHAADEAIDACSDGYRSGYTDGRYDGLIQAYEIANEPHLADLVRLERANNRGEK